MLYTARLVLDLEEMKIRKCETYRILGALKVPYLIKIYPAFCEPIKFIAVFKKVRHCIYNHVVPNTTSHLFVIPQNLRFIVSISMAVL